MTEADPIRIGRGRIRCLDCGHSIPLAPGGLAAWKKQADDFEIFHRHPKNEAPRQVPAGGEQNETQGVSTHEQDHSTSA